LRELTKGSEQLQKAEFKEQIVEGTAADQKFLQNAQGALAGVS
jgi:hypothetical protein